MNLQQLGLFGSGANAATLTSAAATSIFTNGALNANLGTSTRSVVSSSGSVIDSAGVTGGAGGSANTSSTTTLSVLEEGGSLTIQTTDGAQITVHFGAAGAGIASQSGSSSDAALLNVSNMQVEIDGHLSNADAQAVSNVLSQVDSLATQYFSGDVQDAFAAAASLSVDPNEIAGMSLNLLYTNQVYQATTTSNTPTPVTAPTSASPQASTPGGSANSGAASASTGSNPSSSSTASTTETGTSPLQVILKFLRGVSGKLGRNTHSDQLDLPSSLKLKLLARAIAQQAQAGTTALAPQGASAPAPQGTSAPSAGATSSGSKRQAAQLAAATLSQMAG